ncbi:hypothetical protein C1631_001175 [Chryseobacterium phosphatilyticum]|uniref:Uncharacterized protein n=1 Tax=Chryseobacterium phosphatilyticum TaxID=475075 RepID=A0A316XEX0_9FLAO|nr:hypothetical protein [Chryseobacterium phosphatilyticum]PWN71266.1 hypothetical protein C1631_001175 [Chryseobacterium phosphatilyticum]
MKEKWITYPLILEGITVDLISLDKEYFEKLYTAASDKELWELIPWEEPKVKIEGKIEAKKELIKEA